MLGQRHKLEPHRGMLVFCLGVSSPLILPVILGPAAWIMGTADLRKNRAGSMDPEGYGLTYTGRICGIIGTIWGMIVLGFLLLAPALGYWPLR